MAHPVSWWQDQIDLAKKFRRQFGRSDDWQQLKEYLRNQFDTDGDEGIQPYNLLHTTLRSTLPKIYHKDPYIIVRPHNDRLSIPARLREAALNYVVKHNGTKQTMREIATHTWMFGRGAGLVGFDAPSPRTFEEELVGVSKKGQRHEFNLYKKEGLPWFVAIHPENHLVPFGVKDITDTPWAAHAVIRDLEDLKKDDRYNTKDLAETHLPEDYLRDDVRRLFDEGGDSTKLVYFWEIHDFRTGTVMALIENRKKWLRTPVDDPSQVDGLPFVSCVFNPDTDYYWATSDAMYLEPILLEGNEVRTQIRAHRKISLLKFIYEQNLFDEAELAKLEEGDVGSFIAANGTNIKNRIAELKGHIPPELYQELVMLRDDAREVTGLGRNQMGGDKASSRQSATEAMLVQQGSENRINEKVDAMAETMLSAVVKYDKLMGKYWDQDMSVKVMGMDGKAYWVKYSAKDMEGEYDIEVDPESMVQRPPEAEKQEMMQIIAMMQQNPSANINYLMRLLLREYRWVDVLEALPEAPMGPMNAQEFQIQQQQAALQQAGGAQTQQGAA